MEIRLFRGLSECPANRNIIFRLYRFSFHKPIKSRLARGRLYLPFITYNRTTESATLRQLNSGLHLLNALQRSQCILITSKCSQSEVSLTAWSKSGTRSTNNICILQQVIKKLPGSHLTRCL